MISTKNLLSGISVSSIVLSAGLTVCAQAPAKPPKTPQVQSTPAAQTPASARGQRKATTTIRSSTPLIVETTPTAPQVVTLLHRLSGLKMVRLLLRSGDVQGIARIDQDFRIDRDVHTNVIAGLALDDGETVAAWLPEVDAEVGLAMPAQPSPPVPEEPSQPSIPPTPNAKLAGMTRQFQQLSGLYQSPDVTVIARDRRRVLARYVGLDGVTGVSVLKLGKNSLPGFSSANDAKEESIAVGHRVHLFSPEPAQKEIAARGALYVRVGEMEGEITRILHAPSGNLARVEIRSPKITAANIGAVAINDAGETLGIIDSVKGSEATILPASVIRGAAKRVIARQASVPRPWLGVRGEQLGAFSMDQLMRNGWQSEGFAKAFAEAKRGLLVTSVAPGSPASKASLTPGDLILSVNEGEVRTADDFSWLLEEAGTDGLLRFTVARPGKSEPEDVQVKLAESPDPFFGLRTSRMPPPPRAAAAPSPPARPSNRQLAYSLLLRGLETVAVRQQLASQLGSSGGLLVLYVQPATPAFKAGFRPGDVIETINGQDVNTPEAIKLVDKQNVSYSFAVVRDRQKVVLTMAANQK